MAASASAAAAASIDVKSYLPAVPPKTYKKYVCKEVNGKVEPKEYPLLPPADDEVQIRMVASGVCATDVDLLSGKFGPMFPFGADGITAGHEGVGVVSAVGKLVKSHSIGDKVGVGVTVDSCGACGWCAGGEDNVCDKKTNTIAASGTFAEYMNVKARFAVKIPDGLSELEGAGPLFCAGATVYAPFLNHSIKPGDHVAVLGIGGLGHLALKIAHKWGCTVTALSTNASKKEANLKLGAHHFVDIKADPEMKACASTFDHILLCSNGGDTNWNALFSSLRPNGRLTLLGIPSMKDIPVNPLILLMGQRSLSGSAAGGLKHYNSMIAFCAKHNILPQNEKFAFADINKAIDAVKAGSLRFRAVLVHPK